MRRTGRLAGVRGEDDVPAQARGELLAVFSAWKNR
jgi:hypothetical protein